MALCVSVNGPPSMVLCSETRQAIGQSRLGASVRVGHQDVRFGSFWMGVRVLVNKVRGFQFCGWFVSMKASLTNSCRRQGITVHAYIIRIFVWNSIGKLNGWEGFLGGWLKAESGKGSWRGALAVYGLWGQLGRGYPHIPKLRPRTFQKLDFSCWHRGFDHAHGASSGCWCVRDR